MRQLIQQLRDAAEQADSGLVRTLVMREEHEPNSLSMLVVFESDEKARLAGEQPPPADRLVAARATMAEIFDGPPSFTDFVVVEEYTPES